MNVKAAVLSLATVGLFAVPAFALAQGVGPSVPLSSLTPLTGSPTTPGSLLESSPFHVGDVTLSGQDATKSIMSFGSGSGNTDPIGGGLPGPQASPGTPEPGTVALLVGGFTGGLLALRRRKK